MNDDRLPPEDIDPPADGTPDASDTPGRGAAGGVGGAADAGIGLAGSAVLQSAGVPAPAAQAISSAAAPTARRLTVWLAVAALGVIGVVVPLLLLVLAGGPRVALETADENARLEGIPEQYLIDYQMAALNHDVPWPLLAAIGHVQTENGRFSPFDRIDRDPDRLPLAPAASAVSRHADLHSPLRLPGGGGSHPVVVAGEQHLGTPYVWGGAAPGGFDCSGFVQYLYRQAGVELPRLAGQQGRAGVRVPDISEAMPGDLIYYAPSNPANPAGTEHIGIYYGDGMLLHAGGSLSGGSSVNLIPLDRRRPWADIRRIALPGDGLTAGSAADTMMMPVSAPVSSGFGPRTHPATGVRALHAGVDFAAPTGTPVRAASGGRVVAAGAQSGYGLTVVVDHGATSTLYAHLSDIAVAAGQTVSRGDLLGAVGCTGVCTGPHLHFEVREDGQPTDPMPWLSGGRSVHSGTGGLTSDGGEDYDGPLATHPAVEPPIGRSEDGTPAGPLLLLPDAVAGDPQRVDDSAEVVAAALADARDFLIRDEGVPLDTSSPASVDAFWAQAVDLLGGTIADPDDLFADCEDALTQPRSSEDAGALVAAVWRCALSGAVADGGLAVLADPGGDGADPRVLTGRAAVDLLVGEALRVSYAWSGWDITDAGADPGNGQVAVTADRSVAPPDDTVALSCGSPGGRLRVRPDTAVAWERLCRSAGNAGVSLTAVRGLEGAGCSGRWCAGSSVGVEAGPDARSWLSAQVGCRTGEAAALSAGGCDDGEVPFSRAEAFGFVVDGQDPLVLTVAGDTVPDVEHSPGCADGILFPQPGPTVRPDGALVDPACDPIENVWAAAHAFVEQQQPLTDTLLSDDLGDLSDRQRHSLMVGGWAAPGLNWAVGDDVAQEGFLRDGPAREPRAPEVCRATIRARLHDLQRQPDRFLDDPASVAASLIIDPARGLPAAGAAPLDEGRWSPQPAPTDGDCAGLGGADRWPHVVAAEVRGWVGTAADWGGADGAGAVALRRAGGIAAAAERLAGEVGAAEPGRDAMLPRLSPSRRSWATPSAFSRLAEGRRLSVGEQTVRVAVFLGSGLYEQDPRRGEDAPGWGELVAAGDTPALSPLQADPRNRAGHAPAAADLAPLDCGAPSGYRAEPGTAALWEQMCGAAAESGVGLSLLAAYEPSAGPSSPLRRGRGVIVDSASMAAVDWLHRVVGCYDRGSRQLRRFPQSISHGDYAALMLRRSSHFAPDDGEPFTLCGFEVVGDGERAAEVPVKRLHTYGWFPSACGTDPTSATTVACRRDLASGRDPGYLEPGLSVSPDGAPDGAAAGWSPGAERVGVFSSVAGLPTVTATPGSVEALIAGAFPPDEVQRAVAVANCESPGLDPALTGPVNSDGSRDHGLFQFNDAGTLQGLLRQTGERPDDLARAYDPQWAVSAARLLWDQRGWQPWVCAYNVGILACLYCSEPGRHGRP